MSQGLIIDAERLPEVNEYGYIISEIALGVLGIDELESSDTDDSVNNESTAVDDLASVSTSSYIASFEHRLRYDV